MRRIAQRLTASAVWRAGDRGLITHPLKWPNHEKAHELRSSWVMLKIRDDALT